ncbi:hypothetical protein EA462_12770 [Natrarchaeobius halalkaliphilus]|uniref:Uncharacterized protein n=1 Tax=Natrarchaeobius halalkaliphilus TaxID=1679091 RepID=A0A3N6M293_9EURY|nr:hypothetical protein [Natrarchaeobius halalkaliphilus]RQG89231.1 hypothetical protein EA462_12770 [Natrarchaeobius halalkaliphilus]
MSTTEPLGQRGRLLVVAVLIGTFVCLPLWFGSSRPSIGGVVSSGGSDQLTPVLEDAFPVDEWPGSREPWERYYMYGISGVAGIWVASRFVLGWRFDRERVAFVPRSDQCAPAGVFRRATVASESEREAETAGSAQEERNTTGRGIEDA